MFSVQQDGQIQNWNRQVQKLGLDAFATGVRTVDNLDQKDKSNYDNYCENDETLLVLRGDGSTDNGNDNDLKTAK